MNFYKKIDKGIALFLALTILIFILYPFIAIFIYGTTKNIVSNFSSNYNQYVSLLKNSISLSLGTVFLTTLLSIIITIVYIINIKVRKIILAICTLGIISPPFVMSLAYIQLFGKRGFITYYLLHLKINPYGLSSIVFVQSLGYISLSVFILIGFSTVINKDIINSAKSLGASTNSIILDIVLPMLRPAIVVIILLTFVRSMADFGTTTIVGGSYNNLALEGYLAVIAEGNLEKAICLNLIICLCAIILFFLCSKSFFKVNLTKGININNNYIIRKQGTIYILSMLITVVVLLIVIMLYMSVFITAFTTQDAGKVVISLENFAEAKEYIDDSFIRTIVYAVITGGVSAVFSHIFQYYYTVREKKYLKALDFIILLPYVLPGTFFGLGYLLAFGSFSKIIIGSATIVILNLIFKQLPLANKVAQNSMLAINEDYLKSVRDLGGNSFYEIKDVIFPLSIKSILISFVNGFTSSVTTLGSIIFLVSPGQKVITMVMFDALETGKYNVAAVIVFYIIIICLTINFLSYLLLRRV